MKLVTTRLSILMIAFMSIIMSSCLKEENTGPFAGTKYEKLGNFNKDGLPDYLVTPDNISPELTNFVDTYLQNGENLVLRSPELFTNNAIADIEIKSSSNVYMTYLQSDCEFENALGFYSYPTGSKPKSAKEIKTITYAFPNVGPKTPLKAGDKVHLGKFEAGTSIGFALIINAWEAKTGKLNPNSTHFVTDYILNPEKDPGLRKHAVLISYPREKKVLVGFEDLNRENEMCDHDFNDVVFYCTVTQ